MLIVFTLLLIQCNSNKNEQIKFRIDIWDINSSLSLTRKYHFVNDTITICQIGTLVGERDSIIYKRNLNSIENIKIQNFLKTFPLDQINDRYENRLMDDGDRKRIEIKINNKEKSVFIANTYQKNIDDLIKTLNTTFKKDLQLDFAIHNK